MAWKVYRPNDGKPVRWGAVAILVGLGLFAARNWYYWQSGWRLRGLAIGGHTLNVGEIGSAVIFIAMLVFSYWLCFANVKASNFLIEVEIELRKVTWPTVRPWFSTKAEVWASTYVVLAVVVVLTAFIYVIDAVYGIIYKLVFLS